MKSIPLKHKIYTTRGSSLVFGNAIKILRSLPDHSIDHCITDPPYNISGYEYKKKIGWLQSNRVWEDDKSFRKIDVRWDKFSDENYLEFTREWILEILRVVKLNGNIIVFGSYHNIYQIASMLQELDRKLINSIIWYKRNAFPNVTQRMLCESTEHIIWAVNETKRQAKNWVFNYKELKAINNGVQMRNMWDIPSTPTSERKYGKHPSQKPIKLIDRLVVGMTNKNDLIIDPFMGSGTLPVVAQMNKRRFIGIDNNKRYCNIALKRVNSL